MDFHYSSHLSNCVDLFELYDSVDWNSYLQYGVINACICGIVVHPSYQKQGIGTEIVQKLVEKCREGNLHRHVNQFE
ncbi:GNAT superfamily N-acetyltransferase [Paenibacillus sp. V4I7]|nr:GNAT superfamily N-acetyltransferase [Paenibacillus sp. V4I7]